MKKEKSTGETWKELIDRAFIEAGLQPPKTVDRRGFVVRLTNHQKEAANEEPRKCEIYHVEKKNGDWFCLTAYLRADGSLYLEGRDFTELAKQMFGDEEYEYAYSFSKTETEKLKAVFGEDLFKGLIAFFDGNPDNHPFLAKCEEAGIQYERIHY